MFCCRGSPKYSTVDTEIKNGSGFDNKNKSMMISTYPGMRRNIQNPMNSTSIENTKNLDLVQTGGNALMQYDPETMCDLVKVVVPTYCLPGQLIQVVAPDDSGRISNVNIPYHCKPGSTFLMKFLPVVEKHKEALEEKQKHRTEMDEAGASQTNQIDLLDDHSTNSLKEALLPSPPQHSAYGNQEQTMMINVPPAIDVGTTIYAKVPGDEKRFLPVIVPNGGISQFYVSYKFSHTVSESEMLEKHHGEKQQKIIQQHTLSQYSS